MATTRAKPIIDGAKIRKASKLLGFLDNSTTIAVVKAVHAFPGATQLRVMRAARMPQAQTSIVLNKLVKENIVIAVSTPGLPRTEPRVHYHLNRDAIIRINECVEGLAGDFPYGGDEE
jgi:hypothetical protein